MQKYIKEIQNYIAANARGNTIEEGKRLSITIDKFGHREINLAEGKAHFRIMGRYFYAISTG